MITKFGKHVHLQYLSQMRPIKQVQVTSLRQYLEKNLKTLYLHYLSAYG